MMLVKWEKAQSDPLVAADRPLGIADDRIELIAEENGGPPSSAR